MQLQLNDLEASLRSLRARLERAFGPDTAAKGFPGTVISSGQCAAVSVVLSRLLGADMVSTKVNGLSHWFNRAQVGERVFDFDLTGDQFGFSPVQQAPAGTLYPDTRVRSRSDVNAETIIRARRLAERAGLIDVLKDLSGSNTSL